MEIFSGEKYYYLLITWAVLGLVVFFILLFISAPYGRHTRKGWGPMIPNKLGWIVMELPSLLVFSAFFLFSGERDQPVIWIFFALWAGHYINRSIVYPLRTSTSGKEMPLVIALFAVIFNLVNGAFNGYYFSNYNEKYTIEWLYDARFLIGILVMIAGVVINLRSDHYLLNLRNQNDKGYKKPEGGMFRYVSCPNFFGEILEWTGFAILTWSPAALVFAIWTFFNLVPRALDHHKWYQTNFPDYPAERKAVIPFLL